MYYLTILLCAFSLFFILLCSNKKELYPNYDNVKLDWNNIEDDAISLIKKAEYRELYWDNCAPAIENISWRDSSIVIIEIKFVGINNFTCRAEHTIITVDTKNKKILSVIK